jgi:glucose uptake protein GlcU
MGNIVFGYVLSFLSSMLFTLYIIPKKLSKQKPIYFTMFMGLGFSIVSILMYIIFKLTTTTTETLANPILWWSALAGLLWLVGSTLYVTSIDKIGLSRSNQWKNLQGPIGSILILLFLSEFLFTNVLLIVLAIVLIFISAVLFTIKKDNEIIIDKKGILYAVTAALFFGTNALIRKYVTNHDLVYAQQIYSSLSVFIPAALYLLFKDKNFIKKINIKAKDNYWALIGGAVYYFASYTFVLAYKYIAGSIAFTIVQLNAVWTVLVGILIFKEIDFNRNKLRIIMGIIFSILGVIALLYAQK